MSSAWRYGAAVVLVLFTVAPLAVEEKALSKHLTSENVAMAMATTQKEVQPVTRINQPIDVLRKPTTNISTRSTTDDDDDDDVDDDISRLLPTTLQLQCNLSTLAFSPSRMPHPKRITKPRLFHNKAKLSYGPYMTKCGSSSATTMLEELTTAEHEKYNTTDKDEFPITEEQALSAQYRFLSFLRHPLDRALAGYHQVEVFVHFGWFNLQIEEFNLTWWNKTCLNTTYGDDLAGERKYNCTGSPPAKDRQTILQRFNDFLSDIETKGFTDQHVTPMTYILSTSEAYMAGRSLLFDLRQLTDIGNALHESFLNEPAPQQPPRMHRPHGEDDKGEMVWVIQRHELLQWVNEEEEGRDDGNHNTHGLAQQALEKLCRLYHHDVTCLPYDVPECSVSLGEPG